jgi:hypothetical protein
VGLSEASRASSLAAVVLEQRRFDIVKATGPKSGQHNCCRRPPSFKFIANCQIHRQLSVRNQPAPLRLSTTPFKPATQLCH